METLDFHLKHLDFISKPNFEFKGLFKNIKFITDFNYEKKNVFLRLDLNISFDQKTNIKETILNDLRFQESLTSIQYLLDQKAKLIVGTHRGRPQKLMDQNALTLQPIATVLSDYLKKEVFFVEDPLGPATKLLLNHLKPDQFIFLENLRFSPHETKDTLYFSNQISEYIHIYINDAFGVSHRKHGSVFGLPKKMQKKGMGFLMKKEIEILEKVLHFQTEENSFFALILGGSKVEDKIELIENLLKNKKGSLFFGGAMAYTFLKAKNISIGSHYPLEEEKIKFAKELLKKFEAQKQKVFLPIDHKVKIKDQFFLTKGPEIEENHQGVDIGPKTIELYKKKLRKAKMIFWNGPLGIIEKKESKEGTFKILEALAQSSAFTVVGGGDSAKAVQESQLRNKINFISTGGGASLKYLQNGTLPGIEALKNNSP